MATHDFSIFVICDENAFDFQAPIGDIGQLFSVDRSLEHKTSKPFLNINNSRSNDFKNKNNSITNEDCDKNEIIKNETYNSVNLKETIKDINKNIFETIYHGAVEASMELSKKRYNIINKIHDSLLYYCIQQNYQSHQ